MCTELFKFHATQCTIYSSIPLLEIYCVAAAAKSGTERYPRDSVVNIVAVARRARPRPHSNAEVDSENFPSQMTLELRRTYPLPTPRLQMDEWGAPRLHRLSVITKNTALRHRAAPHPPIRLGREFRPLDASNSDRLHRKQTPLFSYRLIPPPTPIPPPPSVAPNCILYSRPAEPGCVRGLTQIERSLRSHGVRFSFLSFLLFETLARIPHYRARTISKFIRWEKEVRAPARARAGARVPILSVNNFRRAEGTA